MSVGDQAMAMSWNRGGLFEPSLIQNTSLWEDWGLHTVATWRNSLVESITHSRFFIEGVLVITQIIYKVFPSALDTSSPSLQ